MTGGFHAGGGYGACRYIIQKIFKNEDDEDGALFVTPKARGGGDLVATF